MIQILSILIVAIVFYVIGITVGEFKGKKDTAIRISAKLALIDRYCAHEFPETARAATYLRANILVEGAPLYTRELLEELRKMRNDG